LRKQKKDIEIDEPDSAEAEAVAVEEVEDVDVDVDLMEATMIITEEEMANEEIAEEITADTEEETTTATKAETTTPAADTEIIPASTVDQEAHQEFVSNSVILAPVDLIKIADLATI